MKIRKAAPIIGAILVPILLFALAGTVVAGPSWPWSDIPNIQDKVIIAAVVGEKINYQGRLTDSGGTPLTGTYDFDFGFWDAATGGTQVGSNTVLGVTVTDGLFNLQIPVTQSWFNGQALWLEVRARPQGGGFTDWMTPRQEILPVPYALSLRPGAHIFGDIPFFGTILDVTNTGNGLAIRATSSDGPAVQGITQSANMTGVSGINDSGGSGTGVYGYVATGNAIKGEGNDGVGVYGYSDNNYGVYASSDSTSLSAGYFESTNDKAIVAYTSGAGSMDSAGWFLATGGGAGIWSQSTNSYGVYGKTSGTSSNDYGIYGEAGGFAYGVYGHQYSDSGGLAVYGRNEGGGSGVSGYNAGTGNGTWGYSVDYNGVGGATARSDNNYGLYTLDNIYSANYHLSGAVMHVAQNGGDETLERGDVVVIAGLGESPAEGIPPMLQVRKAFEANSTAVVGVVASTYSAEWLSEESRVDPTGATSPHNAIPLTGPGPIAPGDYMLIVVQGPCQVKADAITGGITPGDLLSSAGRAGRAATAAEVSIQGVKTTVPGSTFGKALEPLDRGQEGLIWVFVTLH